LNVVFALAANDELRDFALDDALVSERSTTNVATVACALDHTKTDDSLSWHLLYVKHTLCKKKRLRPEEWAHHRLFR